MTECRAAHCGKGLFTSMNQSKISVETRSVRTFGTNCFWRLNSHNPKVSTAEFFVLTVSTDFSHRGGAFLSGRETENILCWQMHVRECVYILSDDYWAELERKARK